MKRTYFEEFLQVGRKVVIFGFENSLSIVDLQVGLTKCHVIQLADQIRGDLKSSSCVSRVNSLPF